MTPTVRLAWRHLTHYWGRAAILAASVALTFTLPIALEMFIRVYGTGVMQRAVDTPLIAGAKGSRYDLVLANLYFRGRVPRAIPVAELDALLDSELATPIPLLARHTARDYPIVGTTPDYYRHRGLVPARGTLPLRLGDAVLGAQVARQLDLDVGDTILSDRANTYDLALGYPLRMRIVGVLAPAETPDDGAVFVDLKTAWVVEGIGHGHDAAEEQREERVLRSSEQGVVLDSGVVEFTEITAENIDSFHFHETREELPLTGILVLPHDDRSRTILNGRYRVSADAQLLEPTAVIDELSGLIFRIKAFYDTHVGMVSAATGLFLALIVLLSLRVRQREIETLSRMGCARSTVFRLISTELAITLVLGLVVAGIAAGGLVAGLAAAGLTP